MTRVLVLTQCSTRDTVVDWQLAPLKSHRLGIFLRSRVTLSFEATRTLEEMVAVARNARCDVLWVASGWSESPAATLEAFKALRDATKAKIVYVDTFDQVSSPFLSILPYVDLYTKKQLIRDRSFYLKPTRAGCPVADYYEREHGVDLGDWSFGSVAPDAAELDKLMLNWNVASAPHLVRRTKRRSISAAELSRRPIDVHYRVGLEPPEAWGRHYNAHRMQVHKALEGMPSTRHVVNVAGKRKAVTPKQFREELANSKLSIGPFGWGEVCDRDFEIVMSGVGLVKPDMSHLETDPDIYVPWKTYFPFKWTGEDVVEVCEKVLNNPELIASSIEATNQACYDWVSGGGFQRKFDEIMARACR